MVFEYYTYTAGPVAQKVFNAIATFFKTQTFADYLQICIMLGLVATTFIFMLKRDHREIGKWMAVYSLVPLMLINMKGTMLIVDKTEPGRVYNVDNVPYLVALPTWFFSGMMVGITEGVEGIFTTSDDERYGRTGMLFGSELFQLSRHANVRTAELQKQWDDYFENCIFMDIQINNKYSWDELFGAEDIFTFLDGVRQSPLRGMYIDNAFKTCAEAYPVVKKAFEDAAGEDLNLLAQHLWGKNAQLYKSQTEQSLQRSYSKFVGVSINASNIIKQNMVMNAIRYDIDSADPAQTAMNYAYTTNKLHTTSMWASLGLMAREYLPMLHTIMFLMFSSLAFFIAGAAMLPGLTWTVLSNYAKTFAYLATWPSLFAILNAIQLWGLEQMSDTVAGRFGGLALSNANPMEELHSRFSYMTGLMMMSVPAIAGGILKGGSAVMSSMNYQLAGMINSTNARASAAASSGNVDFGNLQMDSHSYNNTSANKFDDNTLTNTGHRYTQNADGSVTTDHADGHRTFNATPTITQSTFQTTAQQSIQEGIQDNLSRTEQSLAQQSMSLGNNISTGMAQTDRWGETKNRSLSYGSGHTTGTEAQVSEGMSDIQSAIKSVSQATGWTEDQSQSYLRTMSVGGGIGFGGKHGGAGKGGMGIMQFLNANAGVNWSNDDRESYSKTVNENQQVLDQATAQYTQGANTITRAAEQTDNKDNRSEIEQYANDFAINYNEGKQLAAQATKSESDMLAYSHALSRMENDSASFTANHIMGFQNFLEENMDNPNDIQRLMTAHQPEDLQEVKDRYGKYIQTEAFKELTGVGSSQSQSANQLKDEYHVSKPTQHMAPEMSDSQSYLMEAGQVISQAKTNLDRDTNMAERQSWELFDDQSFNEVSNQAQKQQEQATHQSKQVPETLVSPKLHDEVAPKTGSPSPANNNLILESASIPAIASSIAENADKINESSPAFSSTEKPITVAESMGDISLSRMPNRNETTDTGMSMDRYGDAMPSPHDRAMSTQHAHHHSLEGSTPPDTIATAKPDEQTVPIDQHSHWASQEAVHQERNLDNTSSLAMGNEEPQSQVNQSQEDSSSLASLNNEPTIQEHHSDLPDNSSSAESVSESYARYQSKDELDLSEGNEMKMSSLSSDKTSTT
ncbi:conjugal transfer mating pair stabilization protein TraG [Vibrio coralliilyticus]|uniref:conjugal transfer mating-pair stabilization protein TraG n=1 Tax=Vibrio TaxID=662 RepID=UPI0009DFCF2D|nr:MULTISPECIES: conjugal transfer mating-pair stabilization protein TraG [Vibrio]NOI21179.1 conjugal transfer mating pair stabilization protein TraG [Vibrio coralliilyticus]